MKATLSRHLTVIDLKAFYKVEKINYSINEDNQFRSIQ